MNTEQPPVAPTVRFAEDVAHRITSSLSVTIHWQPEAQRFAVTYPRLPEQAATYLGGKPNDHTGTAIIATPTGGLAIAHPTTGEIPLTLTSERATWFGRFLAALNQHHSEFTNLDQLVPILVSPIAATSVINKLNWTAHCLDPNRDPSSVEPRLGIRRDRHLHHPSEWFREHKGAIAFRGPNCYDSIILDLTSATQQSATTIATIVEAATFGLPKAGKAVGSQPVGTFPFSPARTRQILTSSQLTIQDLNGPATRDNALTVGYRQDESSDNPYHVDAIVRDADGQVIVSCRLSEAQGMWLAQLCATINRVNAAIKEAFVTNPHPAGRLAAVVNNVTREPIGMDFNTPKWEPTGLTATLRDDHQATAQFPIPLVTQPDSPWADVLHTQTETYLQQTASSLSQADQHDTPTVVRMRILGPQPDNTLPAAAITVTHGKGQQDTILARVTDQYELIIHDEDYNLIAPITMPAWWTDAQLLLAGINRAIPFNAFGWLPFAATWTSPSEPPAAVERLVEHLKTCSAWLKMWTITVGHGELRIHLPGKPVTIVLTPPVPPRVADDGGLAVIADTIYGDDTSVWTPGMYQGDDAANLTPSALLSTALNKQYPSYRDRAYYEVVRATGMNPPYVRTKAGKVYGLDTASGGRLQLLAATYTTYGYLAQVRAHLGPEAEWIDRYTTEVAGLLGVEPDTITVTLDRPDRPDDDAVTLTVTWATSVPVQLRRRLDRRYVPAA